MKKSIKGMTKIRAMFLISPIFIMLTSLINLAPIRSDFTGTWKLNVDKSAFGNAPQNAAVKQFDIIQRNDSIAIRRITVHDNNEEVTTSETISMDGKPCSYVMPSKKTKTSSITWSSGGDTMTTVSAYSKPDKPDEIEYKLSQTWKLSSQGKELVVVLTTPSYEIKAVYDKQ